MAAEGASTLRGIGARHTGRGLWDGLPLVWRVFVVNAAVLLAASATLLLAPVTVSSPVATGEAAIVVGGLAVMLVVDLTLLRRALRPIESLARRMEDVDPLRPGLRLDERASGEVAALTTAFNAMVDRLERERRGAAQRAVLALEGDRRRVADELHEEVGQSLTGVLLQLERAAQGVSGPPAEPLRDAREAARRVLEDIRGIAQRLRPEGLEHLGLPGALRALAQSTGPDGPRVTCDVAADLPRLDPAVELAVYRIAQESLVNAARHADARSVDLRLERAGAGVVLTVADDGRGLRRGDVDAAGGIRGMRERALLVHGELTLTTPAAGGTVVRLEVPGTR